MSDLMVTGADLTGMGARYWYATVTKLAQSVLSRMLNEGEDVRRDAEALLGVMKAGPWAAVESDFRAVIGVAAAQSEAPSACASPEKVQPTQRMERFDIEGVQFLDVVGEPESERQVAARERRHQLIAAMLRHKPELRDYPFAVQSWARLECQVGEMMVHLASADIEQAVAIGKHLYSMQRLVKDARKSLLVDPGVDWPAELIRG